MTDLPIPASAIEAAKRAFTQIALTEKDKQLEKAIEASLRAAFDELGMGRETRYQVRNRHEECWRSRWMPVEES